MIFKSKEAVNSRLLKEVRISWKKNESKIINDILSLTGIVINTENIVCYLDNRTANGYYGGRTITLGVKGGITKDDALMVITHELFHIYYWREIRKMKITKSSPGNESKNERKIAEVAAYLLTSEPCLMKYWPKAKVYVYPEIKDTHRKVKAIWAKRNFGNFIRLAYGL